MQIYIYGIMLEDFTTNLGSFTKFNLNYKVIYFYNSFSKKLGMKQINIFFNVRNRFLVWNKKFHLIFMDGWASWNGPMRPFGGRWLLVCLLSIVETCWVGFRLDKEKQIFPHFDDNDSRFYFVCYSRWRFKLQTKRKQAIAIDKMLSTPDIETPSFLTGNGSCHTVNIYF